MMELLSGPNLVARVGGVYTGPYSTNRAFWDDELGIGSLAAYATAGDSFGYGANYFIAQLDGTCGARAKAYHGPVLIDVSGEYEWALYDANFNATLGAPTGYVYGFEKQSGVYADKLIAMSPGIYANPLYVPQIRTSDRLIAIHGATVTKCALDGSDPEWITEYTLTPVFTDSLYGGQNVPAVSRTKDPAIICLIYPSGGILFYDVVAKQQVVKPWIPRIGANNGAWYSVKFDIYISYTLSGGEWYVSVWANSVRPATLSNPQPLTSVASGRVTQLRVRLLGAHGEPCKGELISWSVSGGGSLTAAQSTTDANGYAYIGYAAPITGGATPTIQAVAEF